MRSEFFLKWFSCKSLEGVAPCSSALHLTWLTDPSCCRYTYFDLLLCIMGHWQGLLAYLNTVIINLIPAFLAIISQNVCQKPISVSQLCLIYCADGHLRDNFLLKHGKRMTNTGQIVVFLLTREMSWRSWCCRENGDTLGWHTGSPHPCWYKLSRGYSCASGLNTHPHLEDKTAEVWKNEEREETCQTDSLLPGYHKLSRGCCAVIVYLDFFCSLVSHKRFMSYRSFLLGKGEVTHSTGKHLKLQGCNWKWADRHLCRN